MAFMQEIKQYIEIGVTAIVTLYVVFRLIPTWETRLQSFQKESAEAIHVLQMAIQQVSSIVASLAQAQSELVNQQTRFGELFGRHEQRSISISQVVEKIDGTVVAIRAEMARTHQSEKTNEVLASLVTELSVQGARLDSALRERATK